MTNFFVDRDGVYIGGFDGAEPPEGAIEIPEAPQDARQIWSKEGGWSEPPAVRQQAAKSTVMQRLIANNKIGAALAGLQANPEHFARWFAPDHPAVYCDDPDAVAFVVALGLEPAEILAP